MRDGEPGEKMILLNPAHQMADTLYPSTHAIFVREGATAPYDAMIVPKVMRRRLLSLRAFDTAHEMIDAEVVEGAEMDTLLTVSSAPHLGGPIATSPTPVIGLAPETRRSLWAAKVRSPAWCSGPVSTQLGLHRAEKPKH